jgi:hypothetical protein
MKVSSIILRLSGILVPVALVAIIFGSSAALRAKLDSSGAVVVITMVISILIAAISAVIANSIDNRDLISRDPKSHMVDLIIRAIASIQADIRDVQEHR